MNQEPTKEEAEQFIKELQELCAKYKIDIVPAIQPQMRLVKMPSEIVKPK